MLDPAGIMKVLTDKRDEYERYVEQANPQGGLVYTYADMCEQVSAVLDGLIAEMAREIGAEVER